MKVLFNENIPYASVIAMREAGYDVASISEDQPGIPDEAVLDRTRSENRIIVTFDRDYGELIYRRGLPVPEGVIYLRFIPSTTLEPAEYLKQLLASGIELQNKFTTVTREQIRQRPLPTV